MSSEAEIPIKFGLRLFQRLAPLYSTTIHGRLGVFCEFHVFFEGIYETSFSRVRRMTNETKAELHTIKTYKSIIAKYRKKCPPVILRRGKRKKKNLTPLGKEIKEGKKGGNKNTQRAELEEGRGIAEATRYGNLADIDIDSKHVFQLRISNNVLRIQVIPVKIQDDISWFVDFMRCSERGDQIGDFCVLVTVSKSFGLPGGIWGEIQV